MSVTTVSLAPRAKESADLLRASNIMPAVVYGVGGEAVSVQIPVAEFQKLYAKVGMATLIDVALEGLGTVKALIHDVQYDPVKGTPTHADFLRIDMNKEMHADVVLKFVGESLAVKGLGGTFVSSLESLAITCLPKDLVSHIDVDISVLATFDDAIHISDLNLGTGITTDASPDTVVAKVLPPLTEDQIKAMEETQVGDVSKIEVEKKGKEEVAEGEAAPADDKKKEDKK